MSNRIQGLIIVPVSQQALANETAEVLDWEGGDRAFTVPLNPDGSPGTPPSHYWCCWNMRDPSEWDVWTATADGRGLACHVYEYPGVTPEQALAAEGLKRIEVPPP